MSLNRYGSRWKPGALSPDLVRSLNEVDAALELQNRITNLGDDIGLTGANVNKLNHAVRPYEPPYEPVGVKWWPTGAVWAWDAATSRSMLRGAVVAETKALNALRTSTALRRGPNNTWLLTPPGVVRQEAACVRLEPATTNKLRYSNNFSQSTWGKTSGVTITEQTNSPNGIYGNWWKVVRGSVTGNLFQQITTQDVVVGENNVGAFWVRAEGANVGKKIRIEVKRGTATTYVGQTNDYVLTATPQLIFAVFQPLADTNNLAVALLTTSTASEQPTEFFVCCASLEKGTQPSSPVESGATFGVRATDALALYLPQPSTLTVTYADTVFPVVMNHIPYKGERLALDRANVPHAIGRHFWNSDRLRFEVRTGDRASFDAADRDRSEIAYLTRYAKNVAVWNAYTVNVQSGFTPSAAASEWFIVGQWHGDANDGRSPIYALNVAGNDLQVIRRHWDGTKVVSVVAYTWTNFPRDTDIRVVVEHKTSQTAGYLNVWINGVQRVAYAGPQFGYWDHPNGGYWKLGIYRSDSTDTAVVHYDNVEIGTASLASRITIPLPATPTTQTLTAVPVNGVYTLDPAGLLYPCIERITAAPL